MADAVIGEYVASPPTLNDREQRKLRLDQTGALVVAGGGGSGSGHVDGATTAIPAGSTNGTPIGSKPAGATAILLELASGDSVSYAIATSQPASAPVAVTRSGATMVRVDEPLGPQSNLYITAVTGSPLFRFY